VILAAEQYKVDNDVQFFCLAKQTCTLGECDEWPGRRSLMSVCCIMCGQSWSVSEIPELSLVNLLTPSMACTELDMLQDVRVLQVSSRSTSILLHLD
jgi:hypothetical protein